VKVLALSVSGFMALLKVAVTTVLMGTPLTAGLWACGAVALTLGASAVPSASPKIGSLLPPQATMAKLAATPKNQLKARMRKCEVGMV
jgi:hypothetical protein